MRKLALFFLLILAACLPAGFRLAAAEAEPEAEWTVMFYLCGSDLESKFSYASDNLREITNCIEPDSLITEEGEGFAGAPAAEPGKVNVLIQTGGSRQWHTEELDMDINPGALQRWRFISGRWGNKPRFVEEQALPAASMADPDTLADFIRWGAENYPAKKTALVLWDHGDGSKTGIFIDEMYKGDVMYIDELGNALRDAGVHLETVLFDACLMANLETACAIGDSANWMVASEEEVAGQGTAVGDWLQRLYYDPQADGEWLGRWICDTTQVKYANLPDEASQQLLTWSVIDLSKIGRVEAAFDRMYEEFGSLYAEYPMILTILSNSINQVERYGSANESMMDLYEGFSGEAFNLVMSSELRWEMMSALKDAVVYCHQGQGRTGARGLSYCNATDFDCDELALYVRNCTSPHYLAFLDAITPWTAPDRVYEKAERLPEIATLEDYRVNVAKRLAPDGTPVIEILDNDTTLLNTVHYNLYRADSGRDLTLKLGTMPAYPEYSMTTGDGEMQVTRTYCASEPWLWPALEGTTCGFDVVTTAPMGERRFLGNIPIQVGTDKWNLRCACDSESGTDVYTVYGLWEGFDSETNMFDRNVKLLSQMAGQDFQILYPIYNGEYNHDVQYVSGETKKIYRSLEIREEPLPPGTYYLEYVVYDLFRRPMPLETIEMQWDGIKAVFPQAESWQGETTLAIPESYW